MCRRWQHLNGHFQDTKAAEELKPYLQGVCKGCCADIANIVVPEVQGFESVVVLQELNEKAWLGGALTGVKMRVDIDYGCSF